MRKETTSKVIYSNVTNLENKFLKNVCIAIYWENIISMRQRSFTENATTWHERTKFAVSTSETSVNFYHITQRYNLEDSHLHIRRRENLKL
jgi:hypothetical protein